MNLREKGGGTSEEEGARNWDKKKIVAVVVW